MNPAEVLDYKADLMVRLEQPLLRTMWKGQVQEDLTKPISDIREQMATDTIRGQAAATIEFLREGLPRAEAFHVNKDMATVVQYAASQLEDTDRLDRTVQPTRAGMARFDGGLPFTDVRGQKMRISWIAWMPVMAQYATPRHDAGEPFECTVLYMFNDHRLEPDDIYDKLVVEAKARGRGALEGVEQIIGRWGFIGAETMYDGQRLGPAYIGPSERKAAEVLAEGDTPSEYTNAIRLVHAFWLLTGQTVAEKSEAAVDKPRRKRADKRGIPPRVVVIRLRNTSTQRAEGESLVEWSHRWVVRGHWAWYHCGPDHPLAQEVEPGKFMCRLWRAPFVKGPAGKPLVVSDKVYALHR